MLTCSAISQCRASNAGAVTIKHVLDTTQDLDSIKQMLGVHRSEMLSLLASKDITAKFNFETIFTDKPTGYYCTHGKCGYQSQEATREVALYLTKGLFEFDAKLLHPEQDSPPSQHYHVRAKLTVSSGVSIISKDVLDRAELSGGVVPYTDNETSFKLFGGEPIKPLGSVGIAWTARNSAKSWTTDFLVFEKTPVEFMLGKDFVLAEGLFVFGDSARATAKLAPLTGSE